MSEKDADRLWLMRFDSPLGPLRAGANPKGVCVLEFNDDQSSDSKYAEYQKLFGRIGLGMNEHLDRLAHELEDYFAGRLRRFKVPVVKTGTPFQCRVWDELRRIPYGKTRSYEEIAAAVGSPKGVRAVGAANGQNRIAIVIPCHRVINKGGALGGYGGGLERKRFLLDLEHGQK